MEEIARVRDHHVAIAPALLEHPDLDVVRELGPELRRIDEVNDPLPEVAVRPRTVRIDVLGEEPVDVGRTPPGSSRRAALARPIAFEPSLDRVVDRPSCGLAALGREHVPDEASGEQRGGDEGDHRPPGDPEPSGSASVRVTSADAPKSSTTLSSNLASCGIVSITRVSTSKERFAPPVVTTTSAPLTRRWVPVATAPVPTMTSLCSPMRQLVVLDVEAQVLELSVAGDDGHLHEMEGLPATRHRRVDTDGEPGAGREGAGHLARDARTARRARRRGLRPSRPRGGDDPDEDGHEQARSERASTGHGRIFDLERPACNVTDVTRRS